MSRFIDKLKKQSEGLPSPMGFRKAPATEAANSILIVARVAIETGGSPVKNIDGADAILLLGGDSQFNAKTLTKITKPLQDTPWGIFIEDCTDKPEVLAETGFDFAVLSPTCPISAVPQSEKTGKILEVESSMDDGLLRAANDLPVDAVLAADTYDGENGLVWHHLMILRHLASLISKPLIVPAPPTITKVELKALWDAGIEAVLVPVDITKDENLKELHDIAAKLPPRKTRKQGKVDAFLPRPPDRAPEPPPEEEDEPE